MIVVGRRGARFGVRVGVIAVVGCALLSACATGAGSHGQAGAGVSAAQSGSVGVPGGGGSTAAVPGAAGAGYALPPVNAGFDYQIGTPYPPPPGVRVLSRDHSARAEPGTYSICYVNAFQAQPEDALWWRTHHGDLLLTSGGTAVIDPDWNEMLLDVSTAAKRAALAAIVDGWIDECAAGGFQAVEVDNLDSWTRSHGLLTQAQAVAYARLLAGYAHRKGLAIGQKNTLELADVGKRSIGFDFAIVEDCAGYELAPGVPECQGYLDAYGAHVIVIEYDAAHYRLACRRYGATLSVVQRDRDVTAPGSPSYVFNSC